MYPSRTLTIPINRPLDTVYAFLAEPRNLARWGSSPAQVYRQVSEHVWQTEDEGGLIHIQFTPRNTFGILDHETYRPGTDRVMTRARVYPNGKGCELCFTIFQGDGISDEKFASDFEWMRADLTVLKTYLES